MRARSRMAMLLGLILFSVCLRVWADPLPRQALRNVYLPLIMRASAGAVTPGASPTTSATPTATSTTSATPLPSFTATPSASLTHTPTTPEPTSTPTSSPSPTTTLTPSPSPTTTLTPSPSATTAPCEAVPRLMSPANGAVLNTLCPLLGFDAGNQWNATKFELQIGVDSDFEIVRYGATSQPERGVNNVQVRRNLDTGTRFYWRVRLTCGETAAPWSEVWSFITGSGGTFAAAPLQSAPISGTLLTSWPVPLSWSEVVRALDYQALWRKVSMPWITYSTWTDETHAQAWGLEPATLYEWSVATRNTYGVGPTSAWWRFTTPSTPPAPHDVLPGSGRFTLRDDGSVVWETD